jgi:hypothetical protein
MRRGLAIVFFRFHPLVQTAGVAPLGQTGVPPSPAFHPKLLSFLLRIGRTARIADTAPDVAFPSQSVHRESERGRRSFPRAGIGISRNTRDSRTWTAWCTPRRRSSTDVSSSSNEVTADTKSGDLHHPCWNLQPPSRLSSPLIYNRCQMTMKSILLSGAAVCCLIVTLVHAGAAQTIPTEPTANRSMAPAQSMVSVSTEALSDAEMAERVL